MESIYGEQAGYLPVIEQELKKNLEKLLEDKEESAETGERRKLYEHLSSRIKGEESMRQKCEKRGLPLTPHSALREIRDAITFRASFPADNGESEARK